MTIATGRAFPSFSSAFSGWPQVGSMIYRGMTMDYQGIRAKGNQRIMRRSNSPTRGRLRSTSSGEMQGQRRKSRSPSPKSATRGRKRSAPNSGAPSKSFYEAKLRRRSNARRCAICFVFSLGALTVVYQAMWTYWLAGVNIPDVEHDPVTGQDRVRRRPDLSMKYDPNLQNQVHT